MQELWANDWRANQHCVRDEGQSREPTGNIEGDPDRIPILLWKDDYLGCSNQIKWPIQQVPPDQQFSEQD